MRDFAEVTRSKSDSKIFKRLLTYAGPYKKNFIWAMVLILIDVLTSRLLPLLVAGAKWIIQDDMDISQKNIYIVIGVVIFVVSITIALLSAFFQEILLQQAGQSIIRNLRDEVFEHIQGLSLNQFNQIPLGKLVTRVTNDTNTLSEMYTSVLVNLIRNTLMMIVQFVIMFVISPKVTLIMAITLPFVGALTFFYRKLARNQYRRVRNENTNMNVFLQENLSGMKLTQIFNQEEMKKEEFEDQNKKLTKEMYKELALFGIYRPLMYIISMAAALMVIYFMGTHILELMRIGAPEREIVTQALLMTSMYLYSIEFYRPLENLSEQFNILQSAFASAEKVFDVLDSVPDVVDKEGAIELVDFKGEIEFKNVWFYYIKDEWVLKDVSFKISPNDTVAFVGATGSGKTTIMNLIVRNYEIIKGQILIDGKDIKDYTINSLRREIGQMPQDVFLFTGSIYSNIAFKDDSISEERVIQAAQYVGAEDFILKQEGGYNHIVRERGNNFSTGQRQLLSFARALVYEPTVMILDEATANIDSETEAVIQESLEKMMRISTMIIVAHRLSTIQKADRIYVLRKGEIVERGSHQELLQQEGVYYSLYQLQEK